MKRNVFLLSALGMLALLLSLPPTRPVVAAGAVEMQVDRIVDASVSGYNRAMAERDPYFWVKYFTNDVHRTGPESEQDGMAAFTEHYEREFATFEATLAVTEKVIHGRSAEVTYSWDAVHRASGRPLKLEMVGAYEVAASGKFKSVTYTFDSAKVSRFLAEVGTAAN